MTAQTYRVRNLKKYQHYKNRNPPWVKLHNKLLADQEFVGLRDSAWRLAFELVLLSSTNGELIPADAQSLSFLLRRKVKQADIQLLESIGFIVDASNNASKVLAECLQPAPDFASEIRGQSTETEAEQNADFAPRNGVSLDTGFEPWFRTYRTWLKAAGRRIAHKREALEVWKRRKLADHASGIHKKLHLQISAWKRKQASGKFAENPPDPHRYLRNSGWNDEIGRTG